MNTHDQIAIENGMTPMVFPFACDHDYAQPVRKGRAHYECRKCGADISLVVILVYEAFETGETE